MTKKTFMIALMTTIKSINLDLFGPELFKIYKEHKKPPLSGESV